MKKIINPSPTPSRIIQMEGGKNSPSILEGVGGSKKIMEGRKAFTLVELIIVITILAILSTIAFVSFQGFMGNARDSNRAATISNIQKGLEIYSLQTGDYPTPDGTITNGQFSGTTLINQGIIAENISKSININNVPTDPTTKTNYVYSTSFDNKYYQIASVLESEVAYKNNPSLTLPLSLMEGNIMGIPQTYASSNYKAKVIGNYKGLLIKGNKIYNLPSLVFTGSGDLTDTGVYFVVDKKSNLPYTLGQSKIQNQTTQEILKEISGTGISLTGITLPTNKEELLTYSGIYTTALGQNVDLIGLEIYGDKYFTNKNVTTTITPTYTQNTCTTNPACSPTGCTLTTGTPTTPNQDWVEGANNCGFTCNANYSGINCETYTAPNPYASCTAAAQIKTATTTYTGCDTADIIVCSGSGTGYTLSACNVGTNTAGLTSASYGNYFQWGRNKGFANGDVTKQSTTIAGNVGLNAVTDTYGFVWNASLASPYTWASTDITNNWGQSPGTSDSRQGPCVSGYHVPSQSEWSAIVTAGGWGSNGTNMQNALKLPFAGVRYRHDGAYYYQSAFGYYWSSSPNSANAYALYFLASNIYPAYVNTRAHGFSVRCFKN